MLHGAATDRWFGIPGSWAFRQCTNCQGLWLDPRPVESALPLLYENYYTHSSSRPSHNASIWRKLITRLPWHANDKQGNVGYIQGVPPGRVLDLGCGDGKRLTQMALDGWLPVGIDLDQRAVQAARREFDGEIFSGTVHDIEGVAPFDAIVMFHVLEHVDDPLATLASALKLLRPGGVLSIATPNATSWFHSVFGERWRGLEPPRHLQVFSRRGLIAVLREAGFEQVNAFTTPRNAGLVALASHMSLRPGRSRARVAASVAAGELLQAAEWIRLRWSADCGEELVATAARPGTAGGRVDRP